jgi:hypothetical protein
MKKTLTTTILVCLLSCTHHVEPQSLVDWEVVAEVQPEARPVVEPYEVEFLPILPRGKSVRVVGKFSIRNGAKLEYENPDVIATLKRRAAEIGGNTIVYPYFGASVATVAYVPIETGMHGGDEN